MPPTPSASGVCMGTGCKTAGCKAAGLQAAGLRAAGVKAARVALQAAGWTWAFCAKGWTRCTVACVDVQNSSHLSCASPSKEQNRNTLAKPTPKSGPSVVNSPRIACFGGLGGGGPLWCEGRGGLSPPDPPSLSLKAEGSRPPPTPRVGG